MRTGPVIVETSYVSQDTCHSCWCWPDSCLFHRFGFSDASVCRGKIVEIRSPQGAPRDAGTASPGCAKSCTEQQFRTNIRPSTGTGDQKGSDNQESAFIGCRSNDPAWKVGICAGNRFLPGLPGFVLRKPSRHEKLRSVHATMLVPALPALTRLTVSTRCQQRISYS